MLGIVIPAHNEAGCIRGCLESVCLAALHEALNGEEVRIYVVLDNCVDSTGDIARSFGVDVVTVFARNVGTARAAGAAKALGASARWLSFTDADTIVPRDWLVLQLATQADAVCGTVTVRDWEFHEERVKQHFFSTYHAVDGHRHIHGANLGVAAHAYIRAGGFGDLRADEDVALVRALERAGARIAWSATNPVSTSARRNFKAPCGFGETLVRLGRTTAFAANESIPVQCVCRVVS